MDYWNRAVHNLYQVELLLVSRPIYTPETRFALSPALGSRGGFWSLPCNEPCGLAVCGSPKQSATHRCHVFFKKSLQTSPTSRRAGKFRIHHVRHWKSKTLGWRHSSQCKASAIQSRPIVLYIHIKVAFLAVYHWYLCHILLVCHKICWKYISFFSWGRPLGEVMELQCQWMAGRVISPAILFSYFSITNCPGHLWPWQVRINACYINGCKAYSNCWWPAALPSSHPSSSGVNSNRCIC